MERIHRHFHPSTSSFPLSSLHSFSTYSFFLKFVWRTFFTGFSREERKYLLSFQKDIRNGIAMLLRIYKYMEKNGEEGWLNKRIETKRNVQWNSFRSLNRGKILFFWKSSSIFVSIFLSSPLSSLSHFHSISFLQPLIFSLWILYVHFHPSLS